jgi:hypothetical protein
VTYTNTKRGTIIVEKQTSPDGAAGSFTFTGDVAGTIGDGGQLIVSNLVPGQYTSAENDPTPPFDLGSIVCSDANSSGNVPTRTATFNLDPGETVTCVFTNVQRGTITIIKNAIPDGPQDFASRRRAAASRPASMTTPTQRSRTPRRSRASWKARTA